MMDYLETTTDMQPAHCSISAFKIGPKAMEAIFSRYSEHVKELLQPEMQYSAPHPTECSKPIVVWASSAGFDGSNFAKITINEIPVQLEKNEHHHYRGLHIVAINHHNGSISLAKVFDTYKTSYGLQNAIESIPDGTIVVAACKDECVTKLSKYCKEWFSGMGSQEIWNLQYRNAFAFIGRMGRKEVSENRALFQKISATVVKAFDVNADRFPMAVEEDAEANACRVL